jgi:hypothetical protein
MSRRIGSVALSRRSLLTLRFPERDRPPRDPRPYPLRDGAPALMAALEPLSVLLREIAGEGALDLSVGAHTQLDALPYGDQSAKAILVLAPGGLLALAAPLPRSIVARTLLMAGYDGPSPLLWGDEEVAARRLPGAEVESRGHAARIVFESVDAAWEAVAVPFGVPAGTRRRYVEMLAARSPGHGALSMRDDWQIVLARRND